MNAAKLSAEQMGLLPSQPVLEDRFVAMAAVGGRWFAARVDRRKVEIRIRDWRRANPNRKLSVPSAAEVGREIFDEFAGEAYRAGLIGAFVWVERLEMGFVEVPREKLADGSFREPLLNMTIDRPVAFFRDAEITDLCRNHRVWIERELELSRRDVTQALFTKDSWKTIETLELMTDVRIA